MATTLGNGVVDYNTAAAEAKKKLVQNQLKINNDPGYVASEQQRALQVIAQRQAQGLDTSGQQKYLTQQLGYKAPAATTTAAPAAPAVAAPKTNAQQGSDYMAQMAAIANRQVTPFSYDPETDPAYQAALKRASANIDAGTSQVQAEMNRRNILNSSITTDRSAEIGALEKANVETTVLPQLMQQAYQKYADQLAQEQQQFANLGTVANSYLSEDQRAIDNTNTTAGLTGNLPGGEQAQQLYSQLMSLKQQAEAKGITAADRSKLSNQADGIRAMLSTMGVDISKLGANTNSVTAGQITPTIRTLAGQNQDLAAQNQTFNQATQTRQLDTADKQYGEQFAYTKARDAISDKQWQAKFDEDVRQNGLSYGLQQLSQQNDQAYRQAQLALSQDDNARAWATLDYDQSQPGSTKTSSLTPNQVLESVKSLYSEPIYTTGTEYDANGELVQKDTGKTKITTDSGKRKQMFETVVDYGLSDSETNQILLSLGMTKKEIDSLIKQYSGE
jgi:hypothetical protein